MMWLPGLPTTRLKLWCAGWLYRLLRVMMRADRYVVTRRGIRYEIELREGVDLAVFALGGFQPHVSGNPRLILPRDGLIIDVGANVGTMTLAYAKVVEAGRVFAFEPTAEAFQKLLRNLSLNPELSRRVVPVRAFVSSVSSPAASLVAYASWRVDVGVSAGRHPVHGGAPGDTRGVPSLTLDEFCAQQQLERVDLIKIDTDGHELEVLKGASATLHKYHPQVIFEMGQYLLHERGLTHHEIVGLFDQHHYTLIDARGGARITTSNADRLIPKRATIDVLAVPLEGRA